ncbi:MAG: sensor histidine kinase [Candidatus Kapaibacteriota bacterium]|jgi:signal transduction histidine kinase
MESEIIALKNTIKRERESRKEAELIIELKSRELFDTNNKLEEALKIREHILSGLGHELQTPLHLIVGNLDLIEFNKTEDNIKIRNLIIENVYNLKKIVKNIAYFSDLEVGKIKPIKVEFNLSKLFDTLSSAFNNIKKNEINLEFSYKRDFKLFTDYEMLLQIFINIIDNSIKYSHCNNIKVNLSCRCFDKYNKEIFSEDEQLLNNEQFRIINSSNYKLILEFHIIDNGIGIKEEILKNILMPFSKFDGKNLHANNGSGLGLPITQKLVNLLGGSMNIESINGHGTDIQLIFEGLEFEYLNYNENNFDKRYNLPSDLQNKFNSIKDTFILDEFETFAKELIVYPALSEDLVIIGKKIISACENFDIIKVQDLAKALE